MDIPDLVRHRAPGVIDDVHVSIGYNYRMTDVQAAIGRVQLTRLPEILERRRAFAERYLGLLEGLPVRTPQVPEWTRPNWQSFSIGLARDCNRREIMQTMLDDGVATRRGVHCAHREPAYAVEPWKEGAGGLSRSEHAQDSSLVLPLFHQMTESEQDHIVSALGAALTRAGVRPVDQPA